MATGVGEIPEAGWSRAWIGPFGIEGRLFQTGFAGKSENPSRLRVCKQDARLALRLQYPGRGCISSDVLRKKANEGEGACSPTEARRPHLPLRGKLGWMTPRAGWKQPENGMHPSFFSGTAFYK